MMNPRTLVRKIFPKNGQTYANKRNSTNLSLLLLLGNTNQVEYVVIIVNYNVNANLGISVLDKKPIFFRYNNIFFWQLGKPKFLKEILILKVTLAVSSQKLTLRNYIDDAQDSAAVVYSNITFERREFEAFDVSDKVNWCSNIHFKRKRE